MHFCHWLACALIGMPYILCGMTFLILTGALSSFIWLKCSSIRDGQKLPLVEQARKDKCHYI